MFNNYNLSPDLAKRLWARSDLLSSVMQGTAWIEAHDLAEMQGSAQDTSTAIIEDWKQKHLVPSLSLGDQEFVPLYALNEEDGTPLPIVGIILRTLELKDGLHAAVWFESPLAVLDGARPRELLASDPRKVVDAAVDWRINGYPSGS